MRRRAGLLFLSLYERIVSMKLAQMVALGLALATFTLAGCSDLTNKKSAGKKGKEDTEHVHGKGPNGGVVFDLGKHHAEFWVDHDKNEAMVLFLGDDEKTPLAVAATELTVSTKETKTKDGKVVAPMTIKMLPKDAANGKASKFVGTDPGIGNVADFEGTVLGQIEGRPSEGKFKE
jgi:hypothetical protein